MVYRWDKQTETRSGLSWNNERRMSKRWHHVNRVSEYLGELAVDPVPAMVVIIPVETVTLRIRLLDESAM